jgi:hypothetical protein
MSAPVRGILARVRISYVYQALTGIKPRGSGKTLRVPAPWRKTSDCNLSLHDGKCTWYDFVAGEGGGVIDLVMRVHGGNRYLTRNSSRPASQLPFGRSAPAPRRVRIAGRRLVGDGRGEEHRAATKGGRQRRQRRSCRVGAGRASEMLV